MDKVCLCGCGRKIPEQKPGHGRPRLYAKRTCGRVVLDARLGGWNEASSLTPRAYLAAARQRTREQYMNAPQKPEDEDLEVLINPRLCECGCGRQARFATTRCAAKVNRDRGD